MKTPLPILYSFRRCPYAMRARLALASSGTRCELREIVLREKAPEFLEASPKGTVPVVVASDGRVIEESLDIMLWALERNDPEEWLTPASGTRHDMIALIARCDDDFKAHLDAYKYPNHHAGSDAQAARQAASVFLHELDGRLKNAPHLFGATPSLADMATVPFVRQFAHVDRTWFDQQDWPCLRDWLDRFLASTRFISIMGKHPKWQSGDKVTLFPAESSRPQELP